MSMRRKCTCGQFLDLTEARVNYFATLTGTVELIVTCGCGRFASAFIEPQQWSTQEEQGVEFKP